VDKYQGQQNDYILLSLVRTKAVGHLRDVRRLVVAMSRARLGLYIFARVSLFKNCFELTPAFSQVSTLYQYMKQRRDCLHINKEFNVSLLPIRVITATVLRYRTSHVL
jgi:hypothetical protein